MKALRVSLYCFLLMAGLCVFSGCATANGENSDSPTKDMNWAQKMGYYLWWPFQAIAYSWASGNPSFSP